MVKKVWPKEVCMVCGESAPCPCPSQSRKKRLIRFITQSGKPRLVEDVKEPSDGSA
jgi:hypothetical protein